MNNSQFIIFSSVHKFNDLIEYLYLNILASFSYFCTVLTSYEFQNLNFLQKLPKVFSLERFPLPFGDSSDVPSFEASVLFGCTSLSLAFPVSDSSMYHVLRLCYCLVAHHCHRHFDTVTFLFLLIDFSQCELGLLGCCCPTQPNEIQRFL